ncbi:MAG TPA: DNA translocase FtsK 4TM domain-containing protein, partial [Myxococcales bacterium]|nr:DNA translocase FtsK 4TM domain-containing protein [Myxococcales bacterium]
MGARRGAAGKKSLARQEIVSRKRQVADEKLKTSSAGRRALAGVFLLGAAAIALVSMVSYDARDRAVVAAHNAAGPAGHALADEVFGLLGVTGFVVPLSFLYAAMVLFVGRKDRRRWPQVLAAVLLCASGSVLAELLLSGGGWAYAPGGAVGGVLSASLTGVFSTVGTLIVVGAVSAAALIVGTQFAFLKLCSMGFHAAMGVGKAVRARGGAMWASQREAFQARREAAAKEKLEEAAFLAQLEADEEELDAAEADAVAEEAMRLAGAAKKKKEKEKEPESSERDTDPRGVSLGGDPAWAALLAPPPAPPVKK